MTYLVDANVLNEPTKRAPNRKVIDWLSANERNLVVDAIILAELSLGILALPRGRKRRQLEQWFEALVQTIDCPPWEAAISRRWAKLVVDVKQKEDDAPHDCHSERAGFHKGRPAAAEPARLTDPPMDAPSAAR